MSQDEPPEESPLSRIGADLPRSSRADDTAAKRESAEFGEDYDLDTQTALKKANEREESTRENFHALFILGLKVVGISLIVIFLARMLHIILPEVCHWISKEGIQEIDRMLFSGAAGGLIIKYLEPILNGKPKP